MKYNHIMKQKNISIQIMIEKIQLQEERHYMNLLKNNEYKFFFNFYMIVIKTEELNYLIYTYFLE